MSTVEQIQDEIELISFQIGTQRIILGLETIYRLISTKQCFEILKDTVCRTNCIFENSQVFASSPSSIHILKATSYSQSRDQDQHLNPFHEFFQAQSSQKRQHGNISGLKGEILLTQVLQCNNLKSQIRRYDSKKEVSQQKCQQFFKSQTSDRFVDQVSQKQNLESISFLQWISESMRVPLVYDSLFRFYESMRVPFVYYTVYFDIIPLMKEEADKKQVVKEKYAGKFVSPQEMLNLLKKNETNRMWILKQLSQLGIDTALLEDYSLHELYKQCDEIIRSTYSIKYLGMNQNQMGIISRRIDPYKEANFNLKELPQSSYTVNKFFFTKPLKTGKKQAKDENLNIENLEQNIKNAFNVHGIRNSKFNKKMKQSPKGSWLNTSKATDKSSIKKTQAKEETCITASEPIMDLPYDKQVGLSFGKSYSRFLGNGMLLVRDPNY